MSRERDVIRKITLQSSPCYQCENVRILPFFAMVAKKGYTFINGKKIILASTNSFYNISEYRANIALSKKTPSAKISNMILNGGEVIGLSDYYDEECGYKDGDIFISMGCIYAKTKHILGVTLINENDPAGRETLCINKNCCDHKLLQYLTKHVIKDLYGRVNLEICPLGDRIMVCI